MFPIISLLEPVSLSGSITTPFSGLWWGLVFTPVTIALGFVLSRILRVRARELFKPAALGFGAEPVRSRPRLDPVWYSRTLASS